MCEVILYPLIVIFSLWISCMMLINIFGDIIESIKYKYHFDAIKGIIFLFMMPIVFIIMVLFGFFVIELSYICATGSIL